mgnify:CR=1 FL=1
MDTQPRPQPPISNVVLCLLWVKENDNDPEVRQEAEEGLASLSAFEITTAHDELIASGSPNAKCVSDLVEGLTDG